MKMKGRNELSIYSEDEEVRKAPRKVPKLGDQVLLGA
jgi:hypothetical protein